MSLNKFIGPKSSLLVVALIVYFSHRVVFAGLYLLLGLGNEMPAVLITVNHRKVAQRKVNDCESCAALVALKVRETGLPKGGVL